MTPLIYHKQNDSHSKTCKEKNVLCKEEKKKSIEINSKTSLRLEIAEKNSRIKDFINKCIFNDLKGATVLVNESKIKIFLYIHKLREYLLSRTAL